MPTTLNEALITRNAIIVDMALGFTAMMRVFEPSSKARVSVLVADALAEISKSESRERFEAVHAAFCQAFVRQVKASGRSSKNGAKVPKAPASYGQAAKILDICSKVWFYYCALPSPAIADRVLPWLHVAIDGPTLRHLKRTCKTHVVTASSIAGIDKPQYLELQALAKRHRAQSCEAEVAAVQYDDIQWWLLNKGRA